MVQNHILKKYLVFGIALLFIGLTAISTIPAQITTNAPCAIGALRLTENATLSGHVTDADHSPIEGARVRVCFHGTYSENFSDPTGYYHVTNIPLCYCLKNATCSKVGYTPETVTLSIYENTTHDFVLYPANYSPSIGNISGSVCRIGAEISNTGLYNITNISWTIYTFKVTSPIRFASGKIPSLATGTTETVHPFRPYWFGIGRFTILVKAQSDNTAPIEKYVKAYAFFIFILSVQNTPR